jgi:peptide chain release factor 2
LETIFDLPKLTDKKRELEFKLSDESNWKDPDRMAAVSKEIKIIETTLDSFDELRSESEYLKELISLQDESLSGEISEYYSNLVGIYDDLELKTILNGRYDASDVILTINAGAGGTDAQDWANMLLRLYTRWVERQGFQSELLDMSEGDEAGIKSATLAISGEFAYGLLKSEHGIHRLVRLSPFNSANKRQTSFASLDVIPQIVSSDAVTIRPDEIRVDTYRASGAGGQHVNKTDSAVRITHLETNIVVQCQKSRSQTQNKETAMKVLVSRLTLYREKEKSEAMDSVASANREISWGNQIRSYVFHPYNMVKDHRTNYEEGNVQFVMDGGLGGFIQAYLHFSKESVR